jgi:hypothetical protein
MLRLRAVKGPLCNVPCDTMLERCGEPGKSLISFTCVLLREKEKSQ